MGHWRAHGASMAYSIHFVLQGTYQALRSILSAVASFDTTPGKARGKGCGKTRHRAVFDKHVAKCEGRDEDVCRTLHKDQSRITHLCVPPPPRAPTQRPLKMGHVG